MVKASGKSKMVLSAELRDTADRKFTTAQSACAPPEPQGQRVASLEESAMFCNSAARPILSPLSPDFAEVPALSSVEPTASLTVTSMRASSHSGSREGGEA